MPAVTFTLTEQFADQRSNEIAYRVVIQNDGQAAVELLNLVPRIPDQVELVEVRDPSLIAVKERHRAISSELEELLESQLLVTSADLRAKYVDVHSQLARQALSATGLFAFIVSPGRVKQMAQDRWRRSRVLRFNISSKKDADDAAARFLVGTNLDQVFKDLFEGKIAQLADLEAKMGGATTTLAVIEPGSFYAVTYIVRFPRSAINPRRFNISVEGTYAEAGKGERHVGGATAALIVSPRPWVLSLVAVLSAMLGVALKLAGSAVKPGDSSAATAPWSSHTVWQCVSATIAALLVFNIYEHTTFGKNVASLGVSWRSALLIGILCGLFNERFIAALESLVGK